MTAILHSWRGVAYENRDTVGGAIAPSAYDCAQFYDRGTLVIAAAGGGAFTLPAPASLILPGFKLRVIADTSIDPAAASAATVAFNAAWTVVGAAGLGVAPFTLLPGGGVDIEVIDTTRILVTAVGAGVAAGPGFFTVADRTALAAIGAAARVNGQLALVLSDNSLWRFDSASAAAADALAAQAVTAAMIVLVPAAGTGRWIRADKAFTLRAPFTFATADAAILTTVPVGFAMRMTSMPYWDVITGFTGGMASTIGISSSNVAGYTVKGDILGGAAGDAAATLVAGRIPGTVGDEFLDADTANTSLAELQTLLWAAGDTIRFDRITSAFTAGSAMFCLPVSLETGAGVLVS